MGAWMAVWRRRRLCGNGFRSIKLKYGFNSAVFSHLSPIEMNSVVRPESSSFRTRIRCPLFRGGDGAVVRHSVAGCLLSHVAPSFLGPTNACDRSPILRSTIAACVAAWCGVISRKSWPTISPSHSGRK